MHVEVTCPCEENFQDRHREKAGKYGQGSDLEARCNSNGWTVICLPVEIGARGYAAISLRTALRRLGLGKVRARTIIKNAADAALRASFWIWLLRDRHKWELSTGFKNISAGNLEQNTAKVVSKSKTPRPRRQQIRKVVIGKEPKVGVTNVSSNTTIPKSNGKQTRKVVINSQPDTRIVIGKDNSCKIPSGLRNIGATCYMNSVIQGINQLLDTKYSHSKSSRITQELSKLILDMNKAPSIVSPTSFWKAFTDKIKPFKSLKPHDASEFFVALSNKLPNKMLRDKFCYKVKQEFSCNSCKQIVNSPLETRYTLIVECQNKSLTQLISQAFSSEVIEGGKCTPCAKKDLKGLKRTSGITIFPSYFAVVVKRFESNGPRVDKIYSAIKDPLTAVQVAGKSYSVKSIVCHTGDPNDPSGHYITLLRDSNSKTWWHCSDSVVTGVHLDTASKEAKNGYIFFLKQE